MAGRCLSNVLAAPLRLKRRMSAFARRTGLWCQGADFRFWPRSRQGCPPL